MAYTDKSQSASLRSSLARSSSPRTIFNIVMTVIAFICGILALIPLIAVLSYVIIQGFSSLRPSLFTELPPPPLAPGGGFGNAIIGTIVMNQLTVTSDQ